MRLIDTTISAMEHLLSDKLRSFLSVLGIVISISAIVLIQILGVSVANSVSDLVLGNGGQINAEITVVPSENNKNAKIDSIGRYIVPEEGK